MDANDRHYVWMGPRAGDADAIRWAGKIVGIICGDASPELAEARLAVPALSIESRTNCRRLWSSANLDEFEVTEVADYLRRVREATGEPIAIVPYIAAPSVERVVRESGCGDIEIGASQSPLVAGVVNKLAQRRLFQEWGVPTPEWVTMPAGNLEALKRKLARQGSLVIQRGIGSLGRSTRALRSGEEIDALPESWMSEDELLVSEFVPGPVINTHGVVCGDKINVSWLSIQSAGVAECQGSEKHEFLYCGNDFSAARSMSAETRSEVYRWTSTIGEGLRKLGFQGIFGADFIWSRNRVLVLEINPRYQGSTPLLTALEMEAGREPTTGEHLRAFGLAGRASAPPPDAAEAASIHGAELVVYVREAGVMRTLPALPSGVTARGLPALGTEIRADACLCRLRFPDRVMTERLDGLLPEAACAVREVRSAITATPNRVD